MLEHLSQAEHVTSGTHNGGRVVGQVQGQQNHPADVLCCVAVAVWLWLCGCVRLWLQLQCETRLSCMPSVEYNHTTTSVE